MPCNYLLHGIQLLVITTNMIRFFNQEETPITPETETPETETPETPTETPETPTETPAE